MSSHVGHTIQKMINSSPVSASVNETTTTVVTNGGSVYQAGLINNKIQSSFQEVVSNTNIIGHVIQSASADNQIYLLSSNGYVFAYEYNTGSCSPSIKDIYSPADCRGDKATHIQAGSNHVVILTEQHKAWGSGDNSEYQLVPQGQCKYDMAVELIITDTIIHDNESCCKFSGNFHELKKPVIPNPCHHEHSHHNDCCKPLCDEECLPQPCWRAVYAGSNITVLADDCNRLYVLGSLHRARNNKDLMKKSCLEDLLSRANASIVLPADQLNCNREPNNENCLCPEKSCKAPFKTDLSKFQIKLNFDGCCDNECSSDDDCEAPDNVCDFLKALQNCNDAPECSNTCEPCEPCIWINVCDPCPKRPDIKSITLLNKRSVCKAVSQDIANIKSVPVCCDSTVEFDGNKYCIDGEDYCLNTIIKLEFNVDCGEAVDLYLDLDYPGCLRFSTRSEKCNVEFPIDAGTAKKHFLLNYGSVLDPVELANLKYLSVSESIFPCPKFKNPFNAKLVNTYLNNGDHVCFIKSDDDCCNMLKHAVTADVPTVLRMRRRILDVGVGKNNLSVLVGGLACPNEILAIGENCHGELGINSNISTVCFKQVNRCLFDCQVMAIFSGKWLTTYITQSGKVYGSGSWKNCVRSNSPKLFHAVCQSWKIKEIGVSQTHLIFVGSDGGIYGSGDNSLGELGLCHIECVPFPTPLSFFHKLSQHISHECGGLFMHPMKRNHVEKEHYHNNADPCNKCCKPAPVKYIANNRIAPRKHNKH